MARERVRGVSHVRGDERGRGVNHVQRDVRGEGRQPFSRWWG